jgi:hypothetical protein
MNVAFCVAAMAGMAMVLPGWLFADLSRANAEKNLEKRSQLALANAAEQYKVARATYDKGDNERTAAVIAEILESVNLAFTSLQETGKDPRRSPKWFKRAEIETRDLLRKLESFQQEMSFADRPMLDKVKAETQKIHDDLLLGLMEGRKKK